LISNALIAFPVLLHLLKSLPENTVNVRLELQVHCIYSIPTLALYLIIGSVLPKKVVGEWMINDLQSYFLYMGCVVFSIVWPLLKSLTKTPLPTESSVTLTNVLKNDRCYNDFLSFVEKEWCHENLLFWREVQDFYLVAEEDRRDRAISIYQSYIAENSKYQVNVSDKIRSDLERVMAPLCSEETRETPDPTVFDAAQKEVYRLMCAGPFQRWLIAGGLQGNLDLSSHSEVLSRTHSHVSDTGDTSTHEHLRESPSKHLPEGSTPSEDRHKGSPHPPRFLF